MADVVEKLTIGSNNLVGFVLTDNGVPLATLPSVDEVTTYIGELVTITRTSNLEDGVDYSQGAGLIVFNPANLVEDLSALKNQRYRVKILVKDGLNTSGVLFGDKNAEDKLYFDVSRLPS